MKTKKFCTNPGCSLKNMKVETDFKKCLGCGDKLNSDHDALQDIFKGETDMFGGLFK